MRPNPLEWKCQQQKIATLVRGRPSSGEETRPRQPVGPNEVEWDLTAEHDGAAARLRRAERKLRFAHLSQKRLKLERDRRLPEHIISQIDSDALVSRLGDEVPASVPLGLSAKCCDDRPCRYGRSP